MEPQIAQLEAMRKRVMLQTILAIVLVIVGFVGFVLAPVVGIISMLLAIALFIYNANGAQKKYALAYKHTLIEGALRETFQNVDYQPDRGMPQEVLKGVDMIDMGNRYNSNDYLRAEYKGVPFEQADVCIQEVTSNGKTTSTVTLFEGKWMVFAFNKSFACDLQVRDKWFFSAKKSGGLFSDKPSMHKIKLEDEAFHKEFTVYAVNEQEAYYILTPHMMERIRALHAKTNGHLLLCFVDNKLHVALYNNKNAFEPPVFSAVDPKTVQEELALETSIITEFVDTLNLDNTLYKTKE